MENLQFNSEKSYPVRSADIILSVFNNKRRSATVIDQDMSVEEISDIISDKLISVVQSQFDETANKLATRAK